jgi:hypothetical protein
LLRFYGHRYLRLKKKWKPCSGNNVKYCITDIVIQGQISLDILLRVCGC